MAIGLECDDSKLGLGYMSKVNWVICGEGKMVIGNGNGLKVN